MSILSLSKSNKYAIHAFTNNRYVRNKILTDCIIEGYHEFLFENRYPYTILYIKTDATLLDVNVHPTKQEIRISKENELRTLIKNAIANTLKNNDQTISLKIKDTNSKPTQTFFDYSLVNEDNEKYIWSHLLRLRTPFTLPENVIDNLQKRFSLINLLSRNMQIILIYLINLILVF